MSMSSRFNQTNRFADVRVRLLKRGGVLNIAPLLGPVPRGWWTRLALSDGPSRPELRCRPVRARGSAGGARSAAAERGLVPHVDTSRRPAVALCSAVVPPIYSSRLFTRLSECIRDQVDPRAALPPPFSHSAAAQSA